MQGLFYAVQSLNPEKDTLTLLSVKDGSLTFDPTKVGNNAPSCQSLKDFMSAVTEGLPKL